MSLAILSSRLGKHQATLEYQWMKRAISPLSLEKMLARRIAGEPLQYILGEQPFGPLTIKLRPPVLIPRPETEHWTIRLAELLRPLPAPLSILDLGTGTGCIPLLICHLLPAGTVRSHGVDISSDAVKLANENAAHCGFSTSSSDTGRNTFRTIQASFLDPLFPHAHLNVSPPFDLVTSNPPYISWPEYIQLPPSVADYEDPKALFGGPDGLDFYHAIAALVARKGFLSPGAIVAVEVGDGQAHRVQEIFQAAAQMRTEIWLDPWKKKRTVVVKPGI
ncbi:S-adenosyl-L-methionine-dependent methyltransferase [Mycena maculata]|uniref:S-adenosyl-L-methionine-dependent methyltransferase n=1 Tax=Mycena maculata TaxID=230809 RepID=A0AAD7NRU9_9AGAR|nr:S-adenosyl-L-methionine-dependent methyltransferase [Mycena maculata]